MIKKIKSSNLLRKISLFLSVVFTVYLFSGFLLSVQAADPPTPGILITSIISTGGTTSNAVHTTSASVVNVAGSITASAVPVATISAYTDYPSASNNLVWTKGTNTWSDTVNFGSLSPGASFTVTYIATSEAGITQTISFKITKSALGGTTVITCAVSGLVKKSDGTAVSGASITVASSSQITGNQQTLETMSTGGFNTSIKANISDWVTATVTYNGANYSAQQYLMTAGSCPMTLSITIPVNPGGGGGGGAQTCPATSGTAKLTADTTWSAQTPSHPSSPLAGVVVTITTPGATSVVRSSAPSGSNGSYTITGLNIKAGDVITIKASGSGYTQTGPWTYTVPSDCGTGLLPDVFMYGSKSVSGKVRKKVGNNSDISFPNIPVALQCDNNYRKSATSDPTFSQYLFADIPSGTTGCKVLAEVRNSGGDVISAAADVVFGKTGPTLILDTTATLKVEIDYTQFFDAFGGEVDPSVQPEPDGPRVAFPFTLSQGGSVIKKVYSADQQNGPYEFTGPTALDSMTPYTIVVDADLPAGNSFGNKAYSSPNPKNLKVGSNPDEDIDLIPKAPNSVQVNVKDTGGGKKLGIDIREATLTGEPVFYDSKDKISGVTAYIFNVSAIKKDNQGRTLPFGKGTYYVGVDTGKGTDPVSTYKSFSFDKYFGSTQQVVNFDVNTPTISSYNISGTTFERYDIAGAMPTVLPNTTVTLICRKNTTDQNISSVSSNGQGIYSFSLSSAQANQCTGLRLKAEKADHTTSIVPINPNMVTANTPNRLFLLNTNDSVGMCPAT